MALSKWERAKRKENAKKRKRWCLFFLARSFSYWDFGTDWPQLFKSAIHRIITLQWTSIRETNCIALSTFWTAGPGRISKQLKLLLPVWWVYFKFLLSRWYVRSPSLSLGSCFGVPLNGDWGAFESFLKNGEFFLEFLATSLNTGGPMCSCISVSVWDELQNSAAYRLVLPHQTRKPSERLWESLLPELRCFLWLSYNSKLSTRKTDPQILPVFHKNLNIVTVQFVRRMPKNREIPTIWLPLL